MTTIDHKKCKDLFIGYFNSANELFVERCYAVSEKQARFLLVRRIAKKKGIDPIRLFGEFNGKKDNYSIRREFEFSEE